MHKNNKNSIKSCQRDEHENQDENLKIFNHKIEGVNKNTKVHKNNTAKDENN